VRQSTPW